jgi:hypothetical protein
VALGAALAPLSRASQAGGTGQCKGPSAGGIQVHYAEQAWQAPRSGC